MESQDKYEELYGFRARILLTIAGMFPSETMFLPVSMTGAPALPITNEEKEKWAMGLGTCFVNARAIPKSSFARKLVLLAEKLPTRKILAVPADGEEFELRVDDLANDTELGRRFACDFSREEKASVVYLGPKLAGIRNYTVKLVTLRGHTLDAVRRKVDELGYDLLEGQAAVSLMKKFPIPCGDEIGFGGSEWSSKKGRLIVVLLSGSIFSHNKWDAEMRPVSNVSGGRIVMRWAVVNKQSIK